MAKIITFPTKDDDVYLSNAETEEFINSMKSFIHELQNLEVQG